MYLQSFNLSSIIPTLVNILIGVLIAIVVIIVGYFLFKFLIAWYRSKKAEEASLDSSLLQIALPRDNASGSYLSCR